MTLKDIIAQAERFGFTSDELHHIRKLWKDTSRDYHIKHPMDFNSSTIEQRIVANDNAVYRADAVARSYIRRRVDEIQRGQ